MKLRLNHLKTVVKQARDEEKAVDTLRLEVRRVLGPIMDTDCKLESLAESVNDRVAVLDRTGRSMHLGFKPSTIIPFMEHDNPEVRSMAANLVPQRFLSTMKDDPHSMVRAVVAKRAELATVREMMKRFPKDEGLRDIYRVRKKAQALNEDGLPNAKRVDEPFDMYGEERLGDAVKQSDEPALTDAWYKDTAFNIIQMYDHNLEYNWEEKAVHNLVAHTKMTSGVEIDEEKLLKSVFDFLEEREDRALERNALKEMVQRLNNEADILDESLNLYTDDSDPVASLMELRGNAQEFLSNAHEVFQIKETRLPPAIGKHLLGERGQVASVPLKAKLPHSSAPRALDEQALDLYVRYWNGIQRMNGEPMKLKWGPHPSDINAITFTIAEAFEQELPVANCPQCSTRVRAEGRSYDGFGFHHNCAECDWGWDT